MPNDALASRMRLRAAITSAVAGTAIFAAKMVAWHMTRSSAVLSDALESTVNVVAATFAVIAIRYAENPVDRDHPYGHGKIEHLAAAFEGGLITFAALLIAYQAIQVMIHGPEVKSIDVGLAVTAGAAVANLALGAFVLRAGRSTASPTLVADGIHILSDVWTTAGVLVGLGLVRLTGVLWFDPIAAFLVGLFLAKTGAGLVRKAAGELLDREDHDLLRQLVDAFNEAKVPGLAGLHRLRALRHGSQVHVDGHVFVPENWTVRQAHEALDAFERVVRDRTGLTAEIAFHLDPCHVPGCSGCNAEPCATRSAPFVASRPLTLEEACGPPPPHG